MQRTKFQKFENVSILRSEIKEHPQNPRIITDSAKKKLKEKISEVGLLQPLIVNKRSGYLLGGHQRLAALDALERYKQGKNNYLLDVSMVDLDEKSEVDMLVFLNNPAAQGRWDSNILAGLAEFTDFESMGFDKIDLDLIFNGDQRFSNLFEDDQKTNETKQHLQDVKEARKQHTDKTNDQSIDYYVTVVCQNQTEKEKLMMHLGIPKGEIYISPREIMSMKKQ